MHIQNNTAANGHLPSLAIPHTADIERGETTPEIVLTREEQVSVCKWTTADITLHMAGHVLALAVAAIQLANRTNGLQTTAEKLAVPTAIFSAGDILATVGLGCYSRSLLAHGFRGEAACTDIGRMFASGFGIALPALILANPDMNAASKAHEALSAVAIGVIGTAMILTMAKWGRGKGFVLPAQRAELQLTHLNGSDPHNGAIAQHRPTAG